MKIGEPLRAFEIGFSPELHELWRRGTQQRLWFTEYPNLFDGSDLEIALSQPSAHFSEWLVAIELARNGLHVLVEKWDSCEQHPRKCHQARPLLGTEGLEWFSTGVAGADLLVFDDAGLRFFVEVKLLADRISERQTLAFDSFDRRFHVPWFRVDVRAGASPGLSDEQFNELQEALRERLEKYPQAPLDGDPSMPTYAPGSERPLRCHRETSQHPPHAVTRHVKLDSDGWRCESCTAVKTRATVIEIVEHIQNLKKQVWAAGGSRSRTSAIPRSLLPEAAREAEREWHRYSRDHIDLSWVV